MNKFLKILGNFAWIIVAVLLAAWVDCYIWNNLLLYYFPTLPTLTIQLAICVLVPIKWVLGIRKPDDKDRANKPIWVLMLGDIIQCLIYLILAVIGRSLLV